ncbi:hypothetical protein PJ985_03200 [Streptomyces sp. ACA25]|uniref:hypothetical protein n=1 Tax=Streptomyces sp. ACA25 TaxID=3022596 RepID=UPI00230792F1|nr:hypothetical protein [Streptomyces sp. ACA25]MDB1086573.1 hypothetical protein [Streptomyces sp. ACA25]
MPLSPGPSDEAWQNPPRRWLRVSLLVAGAGAAGFLAFLAFVLPERLDCGGWGSGLTREGGECVGVTDGSYAFAPLDGAGPAAEFADVQKLIKAENDRVAAADTEYVKVGLLATLTPAENGPLAPQRVLHALQGAYTAQMRANHTADMGDKQPLVQLHLANAGSRHETWEPAVERLVAMAGDESPLVAVVGLSISTEASQAAAEELAAHEIPIVASSASADGLNMRMRDGMIRVTGSNTDFVNALERHVRAAGGDLSRAMLVSDRNDPDLHVATLTDAFARLLEQEDDVMPRKSFSGTTLRSSGPVSLFRPITDSICGTGAEMVLFSGRTGDLHAFLEALHVRDCRAQQPLSVLFVETGPVEDVSAAARPDRLEENGITIVQASAMDPQWFGEEDAGSPAPNGFEHFHLAFAEHVGHRTEAQVKAALRDGYAVANHDAMYAAVRAIRTGHGERQERGEPTTPAGVREALFRLENVQAASGTLSFPEERGGDPGGKPLPVIELPAGGAGGETYVTPVR